MAPRSVLQIQTHLLSATMSFTNNGHTTCISGNKYLLMEVDTSIKMIRVPTVLPMSEKPYRDTMVVELFRNIKALAVDSSFSPAELVATIATYFDFNTSSAESEAATVTYKICSAIFQVDNLTSLGFRNQYGTPVLCRPNEPRPAHLTYLDFRSMI